MPSFDEIKNAVFFSKENPSLLASLLMKVNDLNDLSGVVSITGTLKYNQELTAVTTGLTGNTGTLSYQWYRDDVAIGSAISSTYTTVEADIAKILTVKVSSNIEQEVITGIASAAIAKADGATAPNVTGGATQITGLSADVIYEYKLSTDTAWTAVAASSTSITSLAAGDYDVRIKETSTTLASAIKTVTVSA